MGTSSTLSDIGVDIEILCFERGTTIICEGERVKGLYFVVDGVLEASMSRDKIGGLVGDESAGSILRHSHSKNPTTANRGASQYPSHDHYYASQRHPMYSNSQTQSQGHHPSPGKPKTLSSKTGPSALGNGSNRGDSRTSLAGEEDGGSEMGSITSDRTNQKSLFLIKPGGLAGYLAALTGHPSFITLRTRTTTLLGFLPLASLGRFVERYPLILLTLAKRLISQLSPLVLHIDFALEWGQVNAGQVLCREGDSPTAIYIVLNGRLRSIREKESGFEILGEHGAGESVGELDVLTNVPIGATVHAIRDTEIGIMPRSLFMALSMRYPEITMRVSRLIANRVKTRGKSTFSSNSGSSGSSGTSGGGGSGLGMSLGVGGSKNMNLKTVAILPVTGIVPVAEFAERLRESIANMGETVCLLNTDSVMSVLGKHAFSRMGKLKLVSWLAETEESHRLVLYLADGGVNSAWTQRTLRQADCILLVALGDEDPGIGEFERLLIGMKTYARKELVLLHSERVVLPGSTHEWLKNRLWIHAHHHVQMSAASILTRETNHPPGGLVSRKPTFLNLKDHLAKYTLLLSGSRLFSSSSTAKSQQMVSIQSGIRSDFARLARRLLSKSIGLVLGGGGARGMSHIGIIRALDEAGVPIDMVGGTSIGSFIGGLYAKECDHVSVMGRAKAFSSRMTSKWRSFMDLTWPTTSWFTGREVFLFKTNQNKSKQKDPQTETFLISHFGYD